LKSNNRKLLEKNKKETFKLVFVFEFGQSLGNFIKGFSCNILLAFKNDEFRVQDQRFTKNN